MSRASTSGESGLPVGLIAPHPGYMNDSTRSNTLPWGRSLAKALAATKELPRSLGRRQFFINLRINSTEMTFALSRWGTKSSRQLERRAG